MFTAKISRKNQGDLGGTIVEIEGREIPDLHAVEFSHVAGEVAEIKAVVFAGGKWEFEVPVESVQLYLVAPPGMEVVNEIDEATKMQRMRVVEAGES